MGDVMTDNVYPINLRRETDDLADRLLAAGFKETDLEGDFDDLPAGLQAIFKAEVDKLSPASRDFVVRRELERMFAAMDHSQ